jgi:hypothetical protein
MWLRVSLEVQHQTLIATLSQLRFQVARQTQSALHRLNFVRGCVNKVTFARRLDLATSYPAVYRRGHQHLASGLLMR